MDTYGSLKLSWAQSYPGKWINFISTDTLVYGGAGNVYNVIRSNGEHCYSKSSLGVGVGPVICSAVNNIIAYAESTLKPKIFVLKFPSFEVISTLEGGAVMGYNCLAFSADGNYIASLSSLPDFNLTVWSCATGVAIATTEVPHGSTQVSFNPINWKQLCVMGENHVTLYLLEQCSTLTHLTPMEVPLPTRNGFVGCIMQPPRSPVKITNTKRPSHVAAMDSRPTTAVNQPPTNLSSILYSESYEDIGDKDIPVVVQSHCWTYNSALYCGCKEGQMFSVDIDIGSSHLLINPVSLIEEPDNGDVDSTVMPIIPEELPHSENQPVQSPLVSNKPPTAIGSDTLLVDTEGSPTIKLGTLPGKGDYSSMTYISKLGLFTAGENGVLYCVDVRGNQVEGKASLSISQPVSHLAASLDNAKLVVATEAGSAFIVETDGLDSGVLLFEQDQTSFVGVDCTVDGKYAVSCKASGRVQVWSLENATTVSTICLMEECCSITCLPMCSAVAVGTKSGYLLVVSLLQPDSPTLVSKQCLFYNALSNICCDTGGKCLALVSDNSDVVIVSGKPSEEFKVLGHTALAGYAQGISVQVEASNITVCVVTSETSDSNINQLLLFSLPSPIKEECYEDHTRKLRDNSINKRIVTLIDEVTTFVLATSSVGYGLLASTKDLAKFSISSDNQQQEIPVEAVYPGHQLKGGCLSLSPHLKWLLCAAPDGAVSIRLITTLDRCIVITPHHYRTGGCQHACFSSDGHRIITVGDNRTITCWEWSFSSHGKQKGIAAAEFAEKKLLALAPSIENQNEALAAYPVIDITQKITRDEETSQDNEKTWLDKVIEEAKREDDKKYAEIQDSLRSEIQQLRDKVLDLIKTNETLPDIEKLDRSEFILDLEEHQKHQNEEAELIVKVREEVNMEILAQTFLRELIKQECWDSMMIKGKVLKAFQLRIEVSNYPLQKRSQEEMQHLNRVIQLRKVEMAEAKARGACTPKMETTTQQSKIDDEYADDDLGVDLNQQEEEGDKDPEAFVGSRGSQYGGESTLLYDQFQLHSSQKKNHQLILLKDCVFRMKEKFNQEFEEVFQAKVSEIQHIREKNVRIKKIINDLKLTDENVHEPEFDEDEQPESLLTVKDEEVTVEKYYSPEEKQRMEEAAKLEEERRKAEMGDNPRERALDMMMGGRLEASAEEDLFKDFPRPEFMNKEPAEMTEDEIRLAREFEKKEAAFLEEREKLKKVLEGELKKLQASIEQSMQSFDDRLIKLFRLKLKTELAINQEELKILRLASSLLTEEEINKKEELLNQKLVEYKNQKVHLNNTISVAKKQVEDFKHDYEYVVADDKDLDRQFRKDFSDCEPYVDVLYKAFRKRPRGQRIKVGDSGYNLPVGQDHRSFLMAQVSHPGDFMAEYDSPTHMPEGITHNMWERLVAARRKKVENEQKVKSLALQLAEMQSFLQNRTAEDEYIQQQIQETFKELSKLREDRNQFALNLEVQLLLRQGQVETEPGQLVPDFSQSVLLHRSIIEQLNSQIKTLGEAKLNSMNECKEFKRGIHMLDWEHEKFKMEAEDLIMRTKEIQMLHVTKELQQWLIDEEQGGAKSRNTVDVLEKTLEINNQMHARMMRHQQRMLKKLQNSTAEKKAENQELDKQLKELQVSVTERQQIDDLAGISQAEAGAKERMHNILVRKKLVQAAKAQAQEIAILRAEVERLRMRTFPALVQQAGN